jgi:hypothetical protein
VTLDDLRRNRNLLFWGLHTLGWSAYCITQYLGALLYEKPTGYLWVVAIAALGGFLLSAPLRYLYRWLWNRKPVLIVVGALGASWVTALAWRCVINYSYDRLVEDWMSKEPWYGIFSGTLSSMYLLVCWSGLYFGIKYYETLQAEREAALKASALAQEAQVKMLRYQLNPHFLFNTLNAISTLVLDNQGKVANQAIGRLSDFLRYTLDQDPMKKVTLRQEMDALEHRRIEHVLEFLHRGPQHVRLAARVQAHVVARGVDPVDGGDVEPQRLAAGADRQHRREPPGRLARGGERLGLDLALSRQVGDQGHQLFALCGGLLLLPLGSDAIERAREALLVHRLQQVVEGVRLEGVDRESVERRHEHDHRHALLRHLLDDLDAGEARHLDVEEHQVGSESGDGRQRLAAVGALPDDLDVVRVLEAQFEAAPRQRLVVDDEGAYGHGCEALSKGRVISILNPGREYRTASFWCSP